MKSYTSGGDAPTRVCEPEVKTLLILAANRLPVTIRQAGAGREFHPTVGGLATGLRAFYEEHGAAWVGWPGKVPTRRRAALEDELVSRFRCHPVFLPEPTGHRYYAGFANRTVWPLFHSFPMYARYSSREWEAYSTANRSFCDKVVEIAGPDDLLWIHDYHLMLLPRYVRERLPKAKIGFFLHIPFPPYDVLRQLPWHREIIEGLLGADLIGFHTYDYAQSFLRSVRRLFGIDNEIGRIVAGPRSLQVDVFPMGVDVRHFSDAGNSPGVRREMAKIRRRVGSARLVFSISRLDYTKGILQQLQAFEVFLRKHPEARGKLNYLCVVVPSREKVDRYGELKRQIDEIVGRINSRFGSLYWTPIRYVYRSLSPDELAAFYRCADIALVAPLRDGMNLIAKEYVAARVDGKGVLILSEMAGAARELLEALVVNPNSAEEIAESLERALAMPEEERKRRNEAMRARLQSNDVRQWAARFLRRLSEVVDHTQSLSTRLLAREDERSIRRAYTRASRRLLLLDYDGTLVPFSDEPHTASPSASVVGLLDRLSADPANEVVLMSGRRKDDLERWFGDLDVHLVAEHGALVRWRTSTTWERTVEPDETWRKRILPIMGLFVDRVPGSFIEEKDYSLAWHYRKADVEAGFDASKELVDVLTSLTANLDLQVWPGNKVVEIKVTHSGKGMFYRGRLAGEAWGFLLAAGDDRTDESLFVLLPKTSHSIRVGFGPSNARFRVESVEAVLRLLESLTRGRKSTAGLQ